MLILQNVPDLIAVIAVLIWFHLLLVCSVTGIMVFLRLKSLVSNPVWTHRLALL